MSWLGRSKKGKERRREGKEESDKVVFSEESTKDVKKNMDENKYTFAYPELQNGMSDHILNHRRGNNFEYASLSEGEPEEREALLSRLRSFRPPGGRTTTKVDNMPSIELKNQVHILKLSNAKQFLSTRRSQFNFSKQYILISEILITFVPLISFGDHFTAFKVAILDNRKLDDPVVRTYTGNTNISCNASMSLDYCFSKDDIQDMVLAFVCPQPTLKQGKSWAVVNVHMVLEQFDFPHQTYVKPTFAIFQIPHSGLADHIVDPRHFNGMIQEADLEALKTIKQQGGLTDNSNPTVKTMEKSALAGTHYAGKPIKSSLKADRMGSVKSESTGYIPKEDGDDDDEPPSIKRMKEDALLTQQEMNAHIIKKEKEGKILKEDDAQATKKTRFANIKDSVNGDKKDEDIVEYDE
jgi:hypothetical protein